MKNTCVLAVVILSLLLIDGCEKEVKIPRHKYIEDVSLKVGFTNKKAAYSLKSDSSMTKETPESYYVALKRLTLLGTNGTADFDLFDEPDLKSSHVYAYTYNNTMHSLLNNTVIPEGEYDSFDIEIYFLQMNLAIATGYRGIERRNIRIYLSDDAETERGPHQSGDMTQIENGEETGWLLGEGQMPNMDPVSPREAAYTYGGDRVNWYSFAGKSGQHYGPFGDAEFKNNAPHPIYSTVVSFDNSDTIGSNLILIFNVLNCWQFEDKNGDGVFGAADLDPVNPTRWHMALPKMTVTFE